MVGFGCRLFSLCGRFRDIVEQINVCILIKLVYGNWDTISICRSTCVADFRRQNLLIYRLKLHIWHILPFLLLILVVRYWLSVLFGHTPVASPTVLSVRAEPRIGNRSGHDPVCEVFQDWIIRQNSLVPLQSRFLTAFTLLVRLFFILLSRRLEQDHRAFEMVIRSGDIDKPVFSRVESSVDLVPIVSYLLVWLNLRTRCWNDRLNLFFFLSFFLLIVVLRLLPLTVVRNFMRLNNTYFYWLPCPFRIPFRLLPVWVLRGLSFRVWYHFVLGSGCINCCCSFSHVYEWLDVPHLDAITVS